MPREEYARRSLGVFHNKIKEARILLVGAGGIGCELLKNLVLTGFGEIHIVDLDTIDLSNLNRQFLFRHEHIKRSKALVAKESAAQFNPHIKLEAHHSNIKDPHFNVDWFHRFDLVFNALDNLDARRHVNKMCLAAEVPLIESGTTGFNGQVQVIIKGKTECYDCNTKEVPKTFPVCTIRSTPSQPIHCIVWARSYLFTEIFGISEDEAPELDHSEDSENVKEIENLRQEAHALKDIRDSMGSDDFPRKIFQKVFKDDIDRLRSMEDMWKLRNPPNPLDFDALSQAALKSAKPTSIQGQRTWTEAENFLVFCDSIKRLSIRIQGMQNTENANGATPVLAFDKDDEDTLDFVAASANMRAIIFGIESKSKFDTKQMAGNIIPAIATTNAMTAGLCVLQAFKVLRNDLKKARNIFLERGVKQVINTETLRAPNPNCGVCSVASSRLTIDPNRATLENLVEDILKKQLGYSEELTINSEAGVIYDPDLDDNLLKKFDDLGVKADSFITVVDDEDENPRVNLSLSISHQSSSEDASPINLPSELKIPRKPKIDAGPASLTNGIANGHISTDSTSFDKKRKRGLSDAGEAPESVPKKGKVIESGTVENGSSKEKGLMIEDGGDGLILIDC